MPEGAVTITVTYTPQRRDLWRATLSWLWHRPWHMVVPLLFPLAVGVSIGALAHLRASRYVELSVGYTGLLAVIGLLSLYVAIRVNSAALERRTMTLGPSGVRLEVGDAKSDLDWDSLGKVWMTRRVLVLAIAGSRQFIAVPRSAFTSPDRAEQCLELAHSNMGDQLRAAVAPS